MGKYLSICIPTNGRIEILKNTLDSIFVNCKHSFDDFEVAISDNSSNSDLEIMLSNSYSQYPNIVYSRTDAAGFLNSINALKMGTGLFLKLQNNYTMFTGDGLNDLIDFVKEYQALKPLVYFKNSGESDILFFDSFNMFSYHLSYWNSWSAGISIWKDDFEKISSNDFDEMFPHVSLLIYQEYKLNFVINDKVIFINQFVSDKGGYNLFGVFSINYLNLMNSALKSNCITLSTYVKIKDDLLYNFLPVWYCNAIIAVNTYTFDLTDIKKSISVNYGRLGYYKLVLLGYARFFARCIKNLQ